MTSGLDDALPVWAKNAVDCACDSPAWKNLLENVHLSVRNKCKTQGLALFADLTQQEQAAIIEREFYDMQQSKDTMLVDFSDFLNAAIDDHIVEHLMRGGKKKANVDHLSEVCANIVETILKRSPPELGTTAKLFLNRPLPLYIRRKIWRMILSVETFVLAVMPPRLSPSLDVLISRHCFSLLEKFYPSYSSRANASIVKTVLSNFMRTNSIALPFNEDGFETLDLLFFLLIPLAQIFNTKSSDEYLEGIVAAEYKNNFEEDSDAQARTLERSLNAICSPKYLGLITASGSLSLYSPFLPFIKSILEEKNKSLLRKFRTYLGGPGEKYSVEIFGKLPVDAEFDDFLNGTLLRGLSGLLSTDTLHFVWDQGLIAGFDCMIPPIVASLLLGNAEELSIISQLSSAVDTFASFCSEMKVEQLQVLLTKFCARELNEVFEIQGSYVLGINDDGVLQAVYPKLQPDVLETDFIYIPPDDDEGEQQGGEYKPEDA